MNRNVINRLNRRISFITTTTKKDEYGVPKPMDTILFSCWSEFWSQNMTEKTGTIGTVLENTVFFNMPEQMLKKINTKMKIQFGSTKYSIVSIDPRIKEGLVRITAKAVS